MNPDSLVAKTLKAKYFPRTEFLQSKVGSCPSYIWRSLLWGREVIVKGSRWRVGNGKNILVYGCNWIPRPCSFKPFSPQTLPPKTLAADLMKDQGEWHEELIRSKFLQEDEEAILNISLPRTFFQDSILWHFDKKKKGIFTDKSGYQVALKLKFPHLPSYSLTYSSWRNLVWNLTVPPKVRIFLWKALQDFLPTQCNLKSRKILDQIWCFRCSVAKEDCFHTLVGFRFAKKVWTLASFSSVLKINQHASFSCFVQSAIESLNRTDVKLLSVVSWSIWEARNNLLHSKKFERPELILSRAESLVEAYQAAARNKTSAIM